MANCAPPKHGKSCARNLNVPLISGCDTNVHVSEASIELHTGTCLSTDGGQHMFHTFLQASSVGTSCGWSTPFHGPQPQPAHPHWECGQVLPILCHLGMSPNNAFAVFQIPAWAQQQVADWLGGMVRMVWLAGVGTLEQIHRKSGTVGMALHNSRSFGVLSPSFRAMCFRSYGSPQHCDPLWLPRVWHDFPICSKIMVLS